MITTILIARAVDLLFLKHKRDEIALLMDLFFDYVSHQEKSERLNLLPDTFTLVTAVATVCGDMRVVSGSVRFIPDVNHAKKTVTWSFKRHHWLIWKDDSYIIDVLPTDGEFGVSVPQAILAKSSEEKRFFRDLEVYIPDLSQEEKVTHDKRFSDLVSLFETLLKKVPF